MIAFTNYYRCYVHSLTTYKTTQIVTSTAIPDESFLTVSSDGRYLAAIYSDKDENSNLLIYDFSSSQIKLHEKQKIYGYINDMKFSPDTSILVIATDIGELLIIGKSSEDISISTGSTTAIYKIRFSLFDDYFLTINSKAIEKWSYQGILLARKELSMEVLDFQILIDGTVIILSRNMVRLLIYSLAADFSTLTQIQQMKIFPDTTFSFTSDGKELYIKDLDCQLIFVINIYTWKVETYTYNFPFGFNLTTITKDYLIFQDVLMIKGISDHLYIFPRKDYNNNNRNYYQIPKAAKFGEINEIASLKIPLMKIIKLMLTIRTLFSLARQKPEYYLNRDVIFEITKYLVENTNYRDLIYLIFDNKDKYQTKDKLINLLVKAKLLR